jgi:hypothetical protein
MITSKVAMNTMRREIPILFCIILLAFSMIVPAFAAKTMPIEVETHREFVSPYTGEVERHASFYAFTGDHIQWWTGGAVFIYNVNGTEARAKIQNFTQSLVKLLKDIGFIIVAGTVKPVYAKIVYTFDGVLEYEGFYFVDDNGSIVIEWAEGKPLTITITAKATINASTATYAGRADWGEVKVPGGKAYITPKLEIPIPDKPIQVLVIPREGFTGITVDVKNFYGNETRTRYLGGGPELYRVEPEWPGITLKDSGTFWDREPIIKIIYDESGRHALLIDWFWHSEVPI